MSSKEQIVTVESRWANALEYAIFGYPAMAGIAGLLLFYTFASSSEGPGGGMLVLGVAYLLGILGAFVLSILIAVSLFFDAKRLGETDLDWQPSPILYGLGGFFFSGLVALHYLYKRHQYVAASPVWHKWWYGVASCFVVTVLVLVASISSLPTMALLTLATMFVGMGVLPIAIYKDAVRVRADGDEWRPNPVNYYLGTFFGSILPGGSVIVSGYYLYKRHRHVGSP